MRATMTEPTFAELMHEAHADVPAPDEQFRARRLAAAQLRRVIDALATRDAPAEALTGLASELAALAGQLEGRPERAGILAHVGAGGMARFVDVARELNPISGGGSALALPLDMWRDHERAWGRVRFAAAYEGPPGHAHGGFVAAVFDQFLGFAQCIAGGSGVTGKLELRYVKPTPLHVELRLEAVLKERVGRLTYVSGKMWAGDTVTAKAQAMFVDIGNLAPRY
jgi:acyl-coenzyme A thioesterase PaaI-like protein